MEKEKEKIMGMLEAVVRHAESKGIKVVVASDEEGNNWNELKSTHMAYGGTKPDYVAVGVFRSVEEDDVFEELCSEYPCSSLSAVGGMCLEHYQSKNK